MQNGVFPTKAIVLSFGRKYVLHQLLLPKAQTWHSSLGGTGVRPVADGGLHGPVPDLPGREHVEALVPVPDLEPALPARVWRASELPLGPGKWKCPCQVPSCQLPKRFT